MQRQCYQESEPIAYPPLRRCAAQPRASPLKKPCGNVKYSGMSNTDASFDVIVVGGGPAGIAAAIALSQTGARTALVARKAPYADNRTTALLGGSVDFLEGLGVWPACRDRAAGLKTMRLGDDTGRVIRAPDVRFAADEIGLDVFGYNIANALLVEG